MSPKALSNAYRGWKVDLLLAASLLAGPALAQSGATAQDTTLDNLVHAPGYHTAPLGRLGRVTVRGSGMTDLVIIPGWGFGDDAFEAFVRDNERRYRMLIVTLPGFGGTPAPPMPAPGTSYADATWIRATVPAIEQAMDSVGMRRPVILGHFVIGTQVALELAARRPDRVLGMVIMGGEPMRYMPSRRDTTGRTPMPLDERVRSVDGYLAPRWFRTVTKATFDTNNYAAPQYSTDSARASELWQRSSTVPMPVMIRYLCEYTAMDLTPLFLTLKVPVRVLVPSFTPTVLADPRQAYVRGLLIESWDRVRGTNPLIRIERVAGSGIFVSDSRSDAVHDAIRSVSRER